MRLIFCKQALKTKQHQNKSKPDFGQWITRATQMTALSLLIIGFGSLGEQTAQAETARIDDITIDRQPDETYDSLIQRAELAATSALQQGFDQGSQITDVYVVILGQNQGVIAPVLAVSVSRPQWNGGSDGFTYFNSARSLLRLDEQQLATADTPPQQRNTPPVTPRQQNNPNPPSAREVINNAPTQPTNSAPSTPLPGSPALVPSPQSPGTPLVPSPQSPGTPSVNSPENNSNSGQPSVAPTTAPGSNFNSGQPSVAPTTAPGRTFNSGQPSVAPTTAPAPGNLPPADPTNPASEQR